MFAFLNRLFPASCIFCRHPLLNNDVCCEYCKPPLPWADPKSIIVAPFYYKAPVDQGIQQLKFHGQLRYARAFAQLFIDYLKEHRRNPLPDCLIPVPLHPKRLRQRGFNQAIEIAKPIGKYFSIPVAIKTCQRIKNTKPQSDLSAKQRIINVKNAFAIKQPITAKHVAIFDDVITTGNTVNELSHLLQKNGVEKIEIWGIAQVKEKVLLL